MEYKMSRWVCPECGQVYYGDYNVLSCECGFKKSAQREKDSLSPKEDMENFEWCVEEKEL